jgi:hypothetical protein
MHKQHCIWSALALYSTLGLAMRAKASESADCGVLHARANADAALFLWPQLVVQGIRFPNTGNVDVTVAGGPGVQYQLRAGLVLSPLDIYKGARVRRNADALCKQRELQVSLDEILGQTSDLGRLSALRAQAAFLQSQQPSWGQLQQKAERRFAVHAITLLELNEVHKRVSDLERKLVATRGDAERLAASEYPTTSRELQQLVSDYLASTMQVDRESEHVRALAAWQFRLSGGVAASLERTVDWYGLAEVSFNIGAFMQLHDEHRYLKLRGQELQKARYEVAGRLGTVRVQLDVARAQARRELEIVNKEAAGFDSVLRTLSIADAPNVAQAVAILTLDSIAARAESAYLHALIDELSSFLAEESHAP